MNCELKTPRTCSFTVHVLKVSIYMYIYWNTPNAWSVAVSLSVQNNDAEIGMNCELETPCSSQYVYMYVRMVWSLCEGGSYIIYITYIQNEEYWGGVFL